MKQLLVIAFLAITCAVQAADPVAINFTGTYQRVESDVIDFSLVVMQNGKTASASFSAYNVDGSGAAPDGDCDGKINAKGELTFKWTDSFENVGTAILRQEGKGFRFSMNTTKVEEPRCLRHYGNFILKRKSTKPPATAR